MEDFQEFYFIRHGETDWNVQGLMQGHTDIDLNDLGRQQAKLCVELLGPLGITAIVSSPLRRCFDTSTIIHAGLALKTEIITDDRLKERCFGPFEGKHRDTAPQTPDGRIADTDGIEAFDDVKVRARTAIAEHLAALPGERVCFVSHGGVGAALAEDFCDVAIRLPNAHPFHFIQENGVWQSLKM